MSQPQRSHGLPIDKCVFVANIDDVPKPARRALSHLSLLEPGALSPRERRSLPRLAELAGGRGRAALRIAQGGEIELPRPLVELLLGAIDSLRKDEAVCLTPRRVALTTQAAADMLGMSRQHLVRLLDAGEIPSGKVGSHRRVELSAVRAYAARRARGRKRGLDELFDTLDRNGKYA